MKVSLIIPVLNEESHVFDALNGVLLQLEPPEEIIIVDAGSKDGTIRKVNEWMIQHSSIDLTILNSPGALPGGGRNLGIKHAKYSWIAFLDAGITPSQSWLKSLKAAAIKAPPGAWGICRTTSDDFWGTLAAAYSWGMNVDSPYTIPGSLFEKSVFNKIGYFREDLRAAEDILWRQCYFKNFPKNSAVKGATIIYSRFPTNPIAASTKWYNYAEQIAFAGLQAKQQVAYFFGVIVILAMILLTEWTILVITIILYFLLRGVLDPIRRSKSVYWAKRHPTGYLIGLIFVAALDLAKCFGYANGVVRRRFSSPPPHISLSD